MSISLLTIVILTAVLGQIDCCSKSTFENTAITGLKNLHIQGEITDYNFFSKAKNDNVISIHHIWGCLEPKDELEEVVAIQIRDQRVPIMYEGAVRHLPLLHSLHIESSQVNILKPNTFQNLPSLRVIKMIDNNINIIPEGVFQGMLVEKLALTFNHISYIGPKAFDDMPKLRSISLDFNNLAAWDLNWFQRCPCVSYLSLKFNELSSLPNWAFKHIQDSLERLNLSNNKITDINVGAFMGLRNLTNLALNNNYDLKVLEDYTFSNLNKLMMLNLAETSIGCLSRSLLATLRIDALLWINNVPLNETCLEIVNEWTQNTRNVTLTLYKTLRNVTTTVKPTTKKSIYT